MKESYKNDGLVRSQRRCSSSSLQQLSQVAAVKWTAPKVPLFAFYVKCILSDANAQFPVPKNQAIAANSQGAILYRTARWRKLEASSNHHVWE
jgi:hypothetical protein